MDSMLSQVEITGGERQVTAPSCFDKQGYQEPDEQGNRAKNECVQNFSECEQKKGTASVTKTLILSETDDDNASEIEFNIRQSDLTQKEASVILTNNAVLAHQRKKTSRLPISTGRRESSTPTKSNKLSLDKRKSRSIKNPTSSSLGPSLVSPDRPTSSCLPEVPRPHPSPKQVLTSSNRSARPLCAVLPLIRSPDSAVDNGKDRRLSKIPVMTSSADRRRAHRQVARVSGQLSEQYGSCSLSDSHHPAGRSGRRSAHLGSSDLSGSHQAAGRSQRRLVRSNSCGSNSGHQTASGSERRLVRSSSCGSNDSHQAAGRSGQRSARSASCGSTGRRGVPSGPSVVHNWSLIDVNDNARLLLEAKTGTVPEHVFHGQPKTDLIVIEQISPCSSANDKKNPASLPHVRNPTYKTQESNPAVVCRVIPARPERVAPIFPSPTAGERSDSRPGSQQTGRRTSRRVSGQRTLEVRGAGRASSGMPAAGCPSPGAQAEARQRPVGYRPNLTPYPHQYVLLGMLGPDLDKVKCKQDKVTRRREYVAKLAQLNREAAQRRVMVRPRVCSSGKHCLYHCLHSQLTPDGSTAVSAPDVRVLGRDIAAPTPVPVNQERGTSSSSKRPQSPPLDYTATAGDSTETPTPDASGVAGGGRRDSAFSESDSCLTSESGSESSLRWGPEEMIQAVVKAGEHGTYTHEEMGVDNIVIRAARVMTSEKVENVAERNISEEERRRIEEERRKSARAKIWEEEAALQVPLSAIEIAMTDESITNCEPTLESPVNADLHPLQKTEPTNVEVEASGTETDGVVITALRLDTQLMLPDPTAFQRWETESLTSGPVWARSESLSGRNPGQVGRSRSEERNLVSVEDSTPQAGAESAAMENDVSMSSSLALEEAKTILAVSLNHSGSSVDIYDESIAESYTDSDRDSNIDSDSDTYADPASHSSPHPASSSDTDSDAEMVDAQEELPSVTSPPDPPPPVLPDPTVPNPVEGDLNGGGGGGGERPVRQCSSDDVFLELPEQMPVRVLEGRCRGEAGCSCGLLVRRPGAVSRATQAPHDPASFVYKNLLVMDLGTNAGSEGGTGKTSAEWTKMCQGSGEIGNQAETEADMPTTEVVLEEAKAVAESWSGTEEKTDPPIGAGKATATEPDSNTILGSDTAPVQGTEPVAVPGRRRRWSSLWPPPLVGSLGAGRFLRNAVRWSDEDLQTSEAHPGVGQGERDPAMPAKSTSNGR